MYSDRDHHSSTIAAGDVESQAVDENKLGKQRNDINMGKNGSRLFEQHFADPKEQVLRSCDKDLQIIIGSDNHQQIRWYHSAIIASHSGVIDTMLLNPTKERQAISEINLPNITVEKWDMMLKFLEDPAEARRMTIKDVMLVAKDYDKYDITKGRGLCSQVLAEYFKKTMEEESELMKMPGHLQNATTIDVVVNSMVLAHEASIDGVGKKEGMNYLRKRLKRTRSNYNGNMFTESHMRKLVPVLLSQSKPGIGWTKAEISSPDFPHLFVHKPIEYEKKELKCLACLITLFVGFFLTLLGIFVQ